MKLGIIIPYYKNSNACERNFKMLMEVLVKQLNDNIILYIYEDGQYSNWLTKYSKHNIYITGDDTNHGVSYARNTGLDFMFNIEKNIDYILFLDSDDMIDLNYINKMCRVMYQKKYDILESRFFIRDMLLKYNKSDIRDGVCGQCIRASLIKDIRFNENICIGEDTLFMRDLWNNRKLIKKLVETNYYYNLGDNRNSLWMRFQRHEIEPDKVMEGK